MVKHTQTICRLLSTICVSVFDDFVELALKELNRCSLSLILFSSLLSITQKFIFNFTV